MGLYGGCGGCEIGNRSLGFGGHHGSEIQNVLLITDFSENARHALDYARAMAERFGAKLYLLHVIGDPTNYIYGEARAISSRWRKEPAPGRARKSASIAFS